MTESHSAYQLLLWKKEMRVWNNMGVSKRWQSYDFGRAVSLNADLTTFPAYDVDLNVIITS